VIRRHPLAWRPILPPHRTVRPPRLADNAKETASGELARDPATAAVEAALFLADEPLTLRKLAAAAKLPDSAAARRAVERLRELLERDGSAFQAEEIADGWQLLTREAFHTWLSRVRAREEANLSPAAKEALTMIAYRQPVTRADIEAIRGVGSADVLNVLMQRGLVRLAGREASLGRPALYATTKKFLQVYGLRSLKDLPPDAAPGG
jgi:segregation and condensation protein B